MGQIRLGSATTEAVRRAIQHSHVWTALADQGFFAMTALPAAGLLLVPCSCSAPSTRYHLRMPRDGTLTLWDVSGPMLTIVCEPVRHTRALRRYWAPRGARRREADRPIAQANRLSEDAVRRHP
jgi:hypothetical protein